MTATSAAVEQQATPPRPRLQVATPPVAQDLTNAQELSYGRSRACGLGESFAARDGSRGTRSTSPSADGPLRMLGARARHETCVEHVQTLAQRVAALEAESSELRCGIDKERVRNQDLRQQLEALKDTSSRPPSHQITPIGSMATALGSTVTVAEETDGCLQDWRARRARTPTPGVKESKHVSSSKQIGCRSPDHERSPLGSVATALSSTVTVAVGTDGCLHDRWPRRTRTPAMKASKRASSSKQGVRRLWR